MANTTAWIGGNGVGLTWSTLINSSDLASIANGSIVLSTVADIANGTALDQFMDISAICAISSSTIAVGANLAFFLYALNEDGSTYGDGQLTAGTQAAKTPATILLGTVNIPAVASTTTLVGYIQGIIIPPGAFRVAMQNNSGFALTSGTQTVKYRTYNQNLNR
jgi:hypothetical protein